MEKTIKQKTEETKSSKESIIGILALLTIILALGLSGFGIYNLVNGQDDSLDQAEVNALRDNDKSETASIDGDTSALQDDQVDTPTNNTLEPVMIDEYMKAKNINIKSQADIPPATTDYKVTLITNQGNIVIKLNKETPITTGNFVALAQGGYYDGLIFHRVIEGFMIQGGDPQGSGSGGPGYQFEDEPFTGDYKRGVVAMANAGPNTNGSQFFIMHKDYDLPPNYTIFGEVLEGIETVDKIATTETDSNDRPKIRQVIQEVQVEQL